MQSISYFLILPSEREDNSSAVSRRYKQDIDFCKNNNLDFDTLVDKGLCLITPFGDYAYLSYFSKAS